jgi:hypothetical protein
MQISFLWWNTSLSPAGKDRATDTQKQQAQTMIDIFTQVLKIDVIVLGEVRDSDINDIRRKCNIKGYETFDGYIKAGKTHFDTCLLFNPQKLQLSAHFNIQVIQGSRTYKVAQRLDFAIAGHPIPLNLLVSHWPSRLHMPHNDPIRSFLAMKLREVTEELFKLHQDESTIVLLGDYNDEPFDQSLAEHLMATRDRELAQRKRHLLYNPFWRMLGDKQAYTHDLKDYPSNGGTYFHKSGDKTKWGTFDQILFSSSFLGHSDWHLNEQAVQIVDIPMYSALVLDPKTIFDHYPVMGVIEKVT